ncbi:MAG: hypothetical protein LLF94_09955 [Chlamydiales bacterium]|nr:hypothetical protein [Chlamydiales bacterium]
MTVLTSAKKMPLEINDLVEVTPEMKESISSFGSTVDKRYHVLPNFRPILEEIAKSY